MDAKKGAPQKIAFEEAMAQLEAVTKRLEAGDGTLDEMIALYEQGMELVKICNARLDAYEARITKLSEAQMEAADGD